MKLKLTSLLLIVIVLTSSGIIYGSDLKVEGELVTKLEAAAEESSLNKWENSLTLELSRYASNSGLLTASLQIDDQTEEIKLRKAFAEIYFPAADLRVGKQDIAWGKTDGVNPTSNFNPTDYTNPPAEDDKLAVSAARLKYYHQDWIIDSVWVPEFSAPELPRPGDYWYLNEFAAVKQAKQPAAKLYNSEAGVRVSRWSRVIDFSVSYYHGWSRKPAMIENQLQFPRKQAVGAAFAKDFGGFMLRGEGAYSKLEETEDQVDYVLGLERDLTDKLYLNTQLMGNQLVDSSDLEYQAAAALQYDLDALRQLELNTIYELETDGYLINPQFNYDLRDGVNFSIGGYVLDGKPEEGKLGKLADKDYLFIKLATSF